MLRYYPEKPTIWFNARQKRRPQVPMESRSNLRPWGRDPFNQNSNRFDREKRTTSKGGPVFSKLFRLDRTDPLSFGPKFPEILVEWIAPWVLLVGQEDVFFNLKHDKSAVYQLSRHQTNDYSGFKAISSSYHLSISYKVDFIAIN